MAASECELHTRSMMSRRVFSGILACIFLSVSSEILAAGIDHNPELLQFNGLVGTRVENRDGQELGILRDFILDMKTGRVRFAIVASGGFLGFHSRYKPVPPDLLSAATAKRNVLGIDLTKADWNGAPSFHLSGMASLSSTSTEQIDSFYEGIARSKDGPNEKMHNEREASRNNHSPGQLLLASDLVGRSVVNREREKFGEILDLLVGFNRESPAFAVVASGKLFRDREHDYLIRIPAFDVTETGRAIVNANRTNFEQAKHFDERDWRTSRPGDNPVIFRYHDGSSDLPADNTGRNVHDRDGSALTPLDQSESSEDLAITRTIRRALMTSDLLSPTAKNIKIITRSGQVTLRGVVIDDLERRQILGFVRRTAGVELVNDQLSVEQLTQSKLK
jgi:sporulation protein YlmC with PRC-barrel domain